ncbi:MAG: phenylalanine--tRNA ligase beta subunit-related protein [Anaerolineae bacterium]
MLVASDAWRTAYPSAAVGLLAMRGVSNPDHHPGLQVIKRVLTTELRERYAGYDRAALKALPILNTYAEYYQQFKKTYHVQLQLESVVFQGKPLPTAAALVEAMFMAELEDHLLTAGHDLESVELPLRIDVARGQEHYVLLNGKGQTLKAGDMYIADGEGILSSILYGPDRRTQIQPETRQVLFTTYAPPGIGDQAVRHHLETIRDNVRIVAPEAVVVTLAVYTARER